MALSGGAGRVFLGVAAHSGLGAPPCIRTGWRIDPSGAMPAPHLTTWDFRRENNHSSNSVAKRVKSGLAAWAIGCLISSCCVATRLLALVPAKNLFRRTYRRIVRGAHFFGRTRFIGRIRAEWARGQAPRRQRRATRRAATPSQRRQAMAASQITRRRTLRSDARLARARVACSLRCANFVPLDA